MTEQHSHQPWSVGYERIDGDDSTCVICDQPIKFIKRWSTEKEITDLDTARKTIALLTEYGQLTADNLAKANARIQALQKAAKCAF